MKRHLCCALVLGLAACQRPPQSNHTASDTTPASPVQCRASDLAMSLEGSDAGAGQRGMTFSLRNTSSRECQTGGYPALRLVDSLGHGLDSIVVQQMAASYGPVTSTTPFALAPDSVAYFQITFTGIPAGITCFPADRLELVPPGASDTLVFRTSIAPCGDHLSLGPIRRERPPM